MPSHRTPTRGAALRRLSSAALSVCTPFHCNKQISGCARILTFFAVLNLAPIPVRLLAADTSIGFSSGENKTTPLVIASGDTNTLSLGGTNTATQSGLISGAGGIVKINAGTITFTAANTYSGGTEIRNGTLRPSGSGTLGDTSGSLKFIQALGALDLNGTSQTIGSLFSTGSGTGAATGAIVNNATGTTSTLTIGSGNTGGGTFTGMIADHTTGTGTIALIKTGSASITLSGTNTYTGTTTVSAGTLLVNGSIAASSVVTVASGGTLGGSGTVNGATSVSSGGTLAPGNSPGLLTFGSSLTLNSGSNSVFEINGTTRGSTFDAVNVAGLTTYGGTFTFSFGTTLPNATTLNLLSLTGGSTGGLNYVTATGSYAGNFTNSGGIWTLTTGGQTLTFTESSGNLAFATSAIPEPSTYAALAGAAALGLAAYRRRRV